MDRPIFCDDMDEEDPYFYVLVAVVTSIVIAVCVCVGFCYCCYTNCRNKCENHEQVQQTGTSSDGQRQLIQSQIPTSDTNVFGVRVAGNMENTTHGSNDDPPPSYEECMQKPPAYHFDGSECVTHLGSFSDETKRNNENKTTQL